MQTVRLGYRRSAVTALLIVSFGIGVVVGRAWPSGGASPGDLSALIDRITDLSPGTDTSSLSRTWELIQSRFVNRPVESTQLVRGAIEGMVNGLGDPYSFYLDPDEATAFDEEINGKFEGIGAELGLKDGRIVIIAPLPETPAERAGLRAQDAIVLIDGTPTESMSLEQAVSRIRGPDGTNVTLTLSRGDQPLTVTIRRQRIQVKSVRLDYRTANSRTVGLVTISSFTQSSAQEFEAVVQDLLVKQPAGLVLDLRNNTGGYLDAAVDVADAFLRDGTIVIEDFGDGQQDRTLADPEAPLESYRLAVLINGGTASAAEILAGALSERRQAPLVGERSFGKGSVQEIQDLPDRSTVKLTVAHWLTPNGRSIDGVGIDPTEPVASSTNPGDEVDQQLDRALAIVAGA